METYCVSCKKHTAIENLEKLNKINNAFIKLCYLWQEKIKFY